MNFFSKIRDFFPFLFHSWSRSRRSNNRTDPRHRKMSPPPGISRWTRQKMPTIYISAKQNGRHIVGKNEFIYSLIRKHNDKAYYACINQKQQPEPCQSAEAAGFEVACFQTFPTCRPRCGWPPWQISTAVKFLLIPKVDKYMCMF